MKILSVLTFISAVLTIYIEYFNKQLAYFFKPLTMILIISIVWFYGTSKGLYRWIILIGLIFSLVGDVFLINPQNFVFGLASFLIAHLCYIAAFSVVNEKKFNLFSLAAFPIGGLILWLVYDGVPLTLKIPVIVYALAISTMLCTAFNFHLTKKTPKALFALSGAFLFVFSDSALAFNKFGGGFFPAQLVILSTYFLAQWLIARSV